MANVDRFETICKWMFNTYTAKNHDYGDSFANTIKKYGFVAAMVRMSDKFNRLETLFRNKGDQKVQDESMKDTLLDLATYSVMAYMALEDAELNPSDLEEKSYVPIPSIGIRQHIDDYTDEVQHCCCGSHK